MKKPYLNQFERYMLKVSPKGDMAQIIRLRLSWAHLAREVQRATEPAAQVFERFGKYLCKNVLKL